MKPALKKSPQWYYHRLLAMGLGEMALRLRSAVRKRFEKNGLKDLVSQKISAGSPTSFPTLPAREQCPSRIREAISKEAAAIMRGEWTVLHGHQINVGNIPSWQKDYLSGGELSGLKPSRELNYRKLPNVDARVVWELSRWVQLVRVAQHAYLINDSHSADYVFNLLEDWVKQNPTGRGLNWCSPMEPGLRLINFVWIDALLRGVELTAQQTKRLDDLVQEIVPSHVWWVHRYLSFGSSANNHLLGELSGLILAQARWAAAAHWSRSLKSLGARLERELLNQFFPDGGNKEQALHYHLFAWELCWQAISAMSANGVTPDPRSLDQLKTSAHFFCSMSVPSEPWDFGDSDDAHITPFYSTTSDSLTEWTHWLSGGSETGFQYWLGNFECSVAAIIKGWQLFPESGYAVMEKDAWKLRFDCSPLGFGSIAAHGHMDALHVSIWKSGRAVMIDPGTGSYFRHPEMREYFLSPQAHNAPHFADSSVYPPRYGAFLWGPHHQIPQLTVSAEQACGQLLLGPNKLKRTIEPISNGWEVRDEIQASNQEFAIHWQLAPRLIAEVTTDGCQITGAGDLIQVSISTDAPIDIAVLSENQSTELSGICSSYYDQLTRSTILRVSGRCAETITVVTKLTTAPLQTTSR